MDRKKIIAIILKHSGLFTKSELIAYTNEQLYATLRCLFLNLRMKNLEKENKS